MSAAFFYTNRPELKYQKDPMVIENALELTQPLWEAKAPPRTTRRFPDIQSVLVHNWAKVASENIRTSYEHGEDLTELKRKVADLSSDLEYLKSELISCRECIDKLYSEFVDRPIIKETRLFDITKDLEVIEPIPIVIEETEDEVVASFPEVEVFAVGAGESEAITNLKLEISELYYELIDKPDEHLGRVPQGWKRVLGKVMRKVGKTERI